jgi:precorrin-4 methylase
LELVYFCVSVLNLALLLYLAYEKKSSKSPKADGSDLVGALTDLRRNGYTVIRLEPGDLIYRSPRDAR